MPISPTRKNMAPGITGVAGGFSGRETLGRVAAGAVAVQILAKNGIAISGTILEVHGKKTDDEITGKYFQQKNEVTLLEGLWRL